MEIASPIIVGLSRYDITISLLIYDMTISLEDTPQHMGGNRGWDGFLNPGVSKTRKKGN